MDKITQKIKKLRPIDRIKKSQGCQCYNTWPKASRKPIRLVLDNESRLVYCDNCGNIVDPFVALQILCEDWENLQKSHENIKKEILKAWDIGRNYRPWKRNIKRLEEKIGRHGEYNPCCPHCHKPFELEDITEFIHKKYTSKTENIIYEQKK